MHPCLRGVLRAIEKNVLYDPGRDELYELDRDALDFVSYFTGRNSLNEILRITGADKKEASELIDYLAEEGLILDKHLPRAPRRHNISRQPSPSLRYLQIHVTERCNLDCRHCYLGRKGSTDLPFSLAKKAVREFSDMGMKLLITGGEPLLYPYFWDLLEYARDYPIRIEVLSNGTCITPGAAARLSHYVDCVQVSLDGLQEGHDLLRGKGSFRKAVKGIENLLPHVDVSIATMIHSGNLEQFPDLEAMIKNLGAREWNLDVPSPKGNMLRNRDLEADPEAVTDIYRNYGFGGETHEGHEDYSCGSHLCSINVRGDVTKCGFFTEGVGNLSEVSLSEAWQRITKRYLPKLKDLDCVGCAFLEECRGGCRYRAEEARDFHGKDPFMCLLYGSG